MEISLAEERAYYFVPQISLEVAHDRVEKKKTSLVAGMFGTLISRPNPAEIRVVSVEYRNEPNWMVGAGRRAAFDRQRVFRVPVGGVVVGEVTVLGQ
jgi:hypothetical protein